MRGHKGTLLGSYRRSDDCGVEVCWGATCALRSGARPSRRGRLWASGALAGIAALTLIVACSIGSGEAPVFGQATLPVAAEAARPYQGRNASFAYPDSVELIPYIRAARELRDAKLLLVDEAHALPESFSTPPTERIATRGKGMVPVRSLDLRATRETIDALYRFFVDARLCGIEGLTVYRAQAESAALAGEASLGCCVELRLCADDGRPDANPPRATAQGRYLLTHAWQYGLIRRYPAETDDPEKGFLFRYVGLAHSVAMTELGLDLQGYLALLHEQRVVTIQKDGIPRYVIVCQPILDGYVSLLLPKGASYQAGLDNTGYAVVACELR